MVVVGKVKGLTGTSRSTCRYHKIDDKLTGWKNKIGESQA